VALLAVEEVLLTAILLETHLQLLAEMVETDLLEAVAERLQVIVLSLLFSAVTAVTEFIQDNQEMQ
jgi:hypothetical protein